MRVPVSLGVYGQGGVDGSGWSLWGGMLLGFQCPRVTVVDRIVGFFVTSLSISDAYTCFHSVCLYWKCL